MGYTLVTSHEFLAFIESVGLSQKLKGVDDFIIRGDVDPDKLAWGWIAQLNETKWCLAWARTPWCRWKFQNCESAHAHGSLHTAVPLSEDVLAVCLLRHCLSLHFDQSFTVHGNPIRSFGPGSGRSSIGTTQCSPSSRQRRRQRQ